MPALLRASVAYGALGLGPLRAGKPLEKPLFLGPRGALKPRRVPEASHSSAARALMGGATVSGKAVGERSNDGCIQRHARWTGHAGHDGLLCVMK